MVSVLRRHCLVEVQMTASAEGLVVAIEVAWLVVTKIVALAVAE